MRQRLRSNLTYANVMATLAVFLVLGGGTALGAIVVSSNSQVAQNTISGHAPPAGKHANIIGGSLNATDLAANAVTGPKIAANAVTGAKVLDNSLTGADVNDGSIASGDLAPAARGARAYAHVSSTGTLSRSRNVDSVSHPFTGFWCIDPAAGIDPASAVLVPEPDFAGGGTVIGFDQTAVVEWNSSGADCPAGTMEVVTLVYYGDSTDDNDGSGTVPNSGDNLLPFDQPFAVVIP